jgi:ATP-dependent DNA helicase RecG
MNPAVEKLIKYLRLEVDRGYDNRAVMGGLQRMLEPWQAEARQAGLSEEIVEVVNARLRDYPRLSVNSRQETLHGLWKRLGNEFPELLETEPPMPEAHTPPSITPPKGEETDIPASVAADVQPTEASDKVEPETAPAASDQPKKAEMPARKEKPIADETPVRLYAGLTTIPGIGPKSAKTLRKLNLETLRDLLWHLPRRYDDYSELKTINRLWYGEEVTIIGTVDDINVRSVRGGRMKLVEAVISDGTGSLRVTWFNQTWVANRLKPGRAVVISGKVDQYLGRLTMSNPDWEPLERKQLHTNRIVPVYPLTSGVSNKWLRRVIHSTVSRLVERIEDPLPMSVREAAKLMPLKNALQQIHFPDNWDLLRQAQHRLAFDEMFLLQLGVLRQKREWGQLSRTPLTVDDDWVTRFRDALPYELTNAQEMTLKDIRQDMASSKPMNRLLQGDVGSGKTVIAAAAIGIAAAGGAQSAIMAPTSILAEQHFQTMLDLLPVASGIPADSIRLLIGATPESEKQVIRTELANGTIKVVVGTHALLEDPVTFANLGLTVIDEQHRFGVKQRATLRDKGENPNLLVMTATPIPRSLALTIYGDLDLTIIDEMPPGRIPTETQVIRPNERTRAHQFIIGQLENGHQAFIIYPLVEESEKIQAMAAVEEHSRLQEEVLNGYKVGLLHGRLSPDEKEAAMSMFRAGEYHAMVSTSVVEVGVDIPNATVVLIEGANRFGLSQLHQFRGRVGRGEHPSYCLLIPDSDNEADNERLLAMETTNDGFILAELDLEQRGPGDFLGTRQSGFAELRTARLTDIRLIEKARREAQNLFAADPELAQPENQLLAKELARFWTTGKGEIS